MEQLPQGPCGDMKEVLAFIQQHILLATTITQENKTV